MKSVSLILFLLSMVSCSTFSTSLKLEHDVERKVDSEQVAKNEEDDTVRE